jgi:hypothetical protein
VFNLDHEELDMKLKFAIATAAAAFAVASGGAAMASTSYDLSTTTPTLKNGDDAFVYVTTPVSAKESPFSYTFDFNLGVTGNPNTVTASIIPITVASKKSPNYKYNGTLSVSNLTATFYDITTKTTVGSISESALTSSAGAAINLAANNKYAVTLTGKNTTPVYNGQFGFDVATAPVPGPTGFLVAIGGMGALLLKRRRSARSLAV